MSHYGQHEKTGKAFVTGERFRTPVHTGGDGYLAVTPNARQRVNPPSLLSSVAQKREFGRPNHPKKCYRTTTAITPDGKDSD